MSHVVVGKFAYWPQKSYTPTLYNTTNNSVAYAKYWREGRYMMIDAMITWSGAGSGAGQFTVSLPSGYLIDTAYLSGGTGTTNQLATKVGLSTYWNAGGSWTECTTVFATTSTVAFHSGSAYLVGTTFGNGYSLQVRVRAPIVGWS